MKLYDKIQMVPISKIKRYEFNPRENEGTIDALAEMIQKVGFNVPLYIDSEGTIIKGHTRFEACKKLGFKEIPCIISEADEKSNRIDRITDNSIHDRSVWDNEALMMEMRDLGGRIESIDKILGIDQDYSGEMFEAHEPAKPEEFEKAREDFHSHIDSLETKDDDFVEITCPDCGEPVYISKKQLKRVNS